MTYRKQDNGVVHLPTMQWIPNDTTNTDWVAYLEWVSEGGVVEPEIKPWLSEVSDIQKHALAMKIGAVEALRTDGGPAYPVTQEALDGIRQTYTDYINEVSSKTILGEAVTDTEKQTVALIRQGFAFFQAVDQAAQVIIASGSVNDPVHLDNRWPSMGG